MQPFLFVILSLLFCYPSLAAAASLEVLHKAPSSSVGKYFEGRESNSGLQSFSCSHLGGALLRSSPFEGRVSRSVICTLPMGEEAFIPPGDCVQYGILNSPAMATEFAAKAAWGFYAHQLINRLAVFTLPPEMLPFFKIHIQYITENAVNPDRRRYAVEGEAERHFIDIDVYGDSAHYTMPRFWKEAVELYSEDTLRAYGIVPWHVYRMKHQLTKAFQEKDVERILRLSADLGHYIADAHVPLHTTVNYNGQLTGQRGIHGFWESRLPEIFSDEYDFFVGKANYLPRPQEAIWEAVVTAHEGLDSVLLFERQLTMEFEEDKKFSFEERNGQTLRVYSREFAEAYQEELQGQVERQMRQAIRMIGSFWYTAWVDAGQPDLAEIVEVELNTAVLEQLQKDKADWGMGEHVMEREEER